MKLNDLRRAADDGAVDTVLLAIADMEGRLQGKRLTARHFLDEVADGVAEGCNYLLAVDVDMETVGGYAMSGWEKGYGDFVMRPGPRHAAPDPVARGHRAADGRPRVGGRLRGRRLAAADPPPPARPARRARLVRRRRHRARVHPLQRHLRGGVGQGLPRPDVRPTSTTSTTRSSAPPASSRFIRRIRQLDGGRGDVGRELQGRVQLRPARDQLPLRRRAADRPTTTRSTRTAPRRSPPRRARRSPSSPSSTS